MSKKTIIKRAQTTAQTVKRAQEFAPDAHRVESAAAQDRVRRAATGLESRGEVDAIDLADKVADALWARLKRWLPIYARLAAADTVHTVERPETVLRRAIAEGVEAARLLREGAEYGE